MTLGLKLGRFTRCDGRFHVVAVALLGAYLGAILWFSRYHLLDDSLIHLRFAELFLEHGFFTSDGSGPSFGTSSPFFVLLAAGLHSLAPSDFTTKILSVAFYLALVAALYVLAARARQAERAGWTALLVLTLMPIGVRWLTDGMETSLAACLAVLFGLAAARTKRVGPLAASGLFVLGAIGIATRIEMAVPIALACIAAGWRGGRRAPAEATGETIAVPLALGAGGGLLLVWLTFGAILPDTAIAKATGEAAPASALVGFLIAFGGALGFGGGLLALWLAQLGLGLSIRASWRRRAVSFLAPNLALALLWAAASVRGQYVQGVRYVLPGMVFMIAANTVFLASLPQAIIGARLRGWGDRLRPRQTLAFGTAAALFLAVFAFDFAKFHDIVENRAAAFLEMRALDLASLEGVNGIGWDVGYLMYFTKGQVCDVSGLINGRQAAASPEPARLENCLKRDVSFVFVTATQAPELIEKSGRRFADWPVCGQYIFQNIAPTAPHYLAVSPQLAAHVCPHQRDEGPLRQALLHRSS